jgi:alpha-D-xyloside xylohydrolase
MASPNDFLQKIAWSFQPSGNPLTLQSKALEAQLYEASGHVTLTGPKLDGSPNVIRLAPPFVQTSAGTFPLGQVVSSASIVDGLELRQRVGQSEIGTRLTFAAEGVLRFEVVDWNGLIPERAAISGASDSSEHFFGLGERFDSLDQATKKVKIITFDHPGNKGGHSYLVAPWFVSSRGYGFHLDTTVESNFDLRATAANRFVIDFPLPSKPAPVLRFQVVYGPLLTDVLSRYTGLTGRPGSVPPFAFGPWISSDFWRTGGEVRFAVGEFRRRDIPASAFVFDSPWARSYNDFRFNEDQFSDAKDAAHPGFANTAEMMTFLSRQGLKVICWMTPMINRTSVNPEEVRGLNPGQSPNYDEGAKNGYFVRDPKQDAPLNVKWWKGQGAAIDFTNPLARDWLTHQLRALLKATEVETADGGTESAVGGFKTDDGEALTDPKGSHDSGEYIPLRARYSDGRTGQEMRNGYCLEYLKTVWNVLGDKGLVFARSGFAGAQAFPACWAGDNQPHFGDDNGLPSVIVAGVSAAMSGFAIWGHDIGGYQNSSFSPVSPANLFMRWTQFGCFSPIMQMHRQVHRANNRQYPWGYGQQAEDNYRFYAKLRIRLFPYIYTYAQEATTTGLPIIRPLVLLHQDDPVTFNVGHTYQFGNEFLVAPILAPNATHRDVYLPRGVWFDYWTSERHTGQTTLTWTNPNQAQFPLFVREGAMIPMLINDAQTLCEPNYVNNSGITTPGNGLEFLIYPADKASFRMFDGTQIVCRISGGTRQITLDSPQRTVVLRIFGPQPVSVQLDDTILPRLDDPAAFDAAQSGWRFDGAVGFALVKLAHAGGFSNISW